MSITIFNHLHYRKRWQHIALSALVFLLVLMLATLLGSASSVDKDLAPTIAHIGANTKPAVSGKLSSEDVQYQVAIALIKTAAWAEVGFDSSRVDDAAYVDKMYRTAFTGVTFDSYMTHPFIDESVPLPCATVGGRRLCSGASGAFQFMPDTWQETYAKYEWWPVSPKGEKFWPPAQDIAFLRLIAETGAYWHLEKGVKVLNNVITVDAEAIAKTFAKAADVWCSFPGDVRGECAGQPQKTLYDTVGVFQKNLAVQQGIKPDFVFINNKADAVIAKARSWVGADFNKGVYAQCAVFVRDVFKSSGVSVGITLDTKSSGDPRAGKLGAAMASSLVGNDLGKTKRTSNPNFIPPGAIVAFTNTYGNFEKNAITHVGVSVGNGRMVDRSTSSAPVRERPITTFRPNDAGEYIYLIPTQLIENS
jgi:muramidase (phage lysozyme)